MSNWKLKIDIQGNYIGLRTAENKEILKPFYDQFEIIQFKAGKVAEVKRVKSNEIARRRDILKKLKGTLTLSQQEIDFSSDEKSSFIIIAKQSKTFFLYKYPVASFNSKHAFVLNLFTRYPSLEFFKSAYSKKDLLKKQSQYYDSIELTNDNLFKVKIVHVYEDEEVINEDQDFILRYRYDNFSWIFIDSNGKVVK